MVKTGMVFSQQFLDDLRSRVQLADLVGRRVTLVKAGKNFKGRCPFHDEKMPSFYVYQDRFHCFGCGEDGDAIAFVMKINNVKFNEAVEHLASWIKLPIPLSAPYAFSENKRLPVSVKNPTGASEVGHRMIENESDLTEQHINSILATAARLLVYKKQVKSGAIIANNVCRIERDGYNEWNQGDMWLLTLQLETQIYSALEENGEREAIEQQIDEALMTAMQSSPDAIKCKIAPKLDHDPDWRNKINQQISGQGISNQGRVRNDNIATRERDGLLFRSMPEIHFYEAIKKAGVPFAPLCVVLHGGISYRRVEPDFVIYKEGVVMIVEIDGDLYHSETVTEAHARLKFIMDEGVRLERISAAACDTPDKAREAVANVLRTIEKHRRSK